MSGLVPSSQKSTVFFCNVNPQRKRLILNFTLFEEGALPVRYLGVPLISSRLLYRDCNILVERLHQRISSWKNRLLSFAGRLQLITSVLSAVHVYWSSVFILPHRIVAELEAKMRGFLWCQGPMQKGKAKVSWKVVCTPKYEGGLGIRRIGEMNKALMINHIWSLLNRRHSLWVDWIHAYRLRRYNFWACRPGACSWSWRKILQIRPLIQNHIWSKLGNGRTTNAWYDNWCELGPLSRFLSPRVISNAGFSLKSKVSDICINDQWTWPEAWLDLFPVLNNLQPPSLLNCQDDRLLWKLGDQLHDFSTKMAWQSVRVPGTVVDWGDIVWFSQSIPKHAFLVWLIMKEKLLTQDKILGWEPSRRKTSNVMGCPLCHADFDSHCHLFFECNYASKLWIMVREKAGMQQVPPKWSAIIDSLLVRTKSKAIHHIVSKLIVAASAYFIWQERNNRLFNGQARPPENLYSQVYTTVRYKLMGLKFKNTERVARLLEDWNIQGILKKESHG